MKLTATIVSLIFNPLLFFLIMPYLVVYKHTLNNYDALKWELFSLLFIFSAVFLLFLGKRASVISNYDMSNREERSKFYIVLCSLAFIYLFVALFFKGIFFPLSLMSLGIYFGILLFTYINQYIKASIHMAVTCAFFLTVNVLFESKLFYLFALSIPLVAWSRLVLQRHTIKEIIAGSFLGCLITTGTFLVGKWLY